MGEGGGTSAVSARMRQHQTLYSTKVECTMRQLAQLVVDDGSGYLKRPPRRFSAIRVHPNHEPWRSPRDLRVAKAAGRASPRRHDHHADRRKAGAGAEAAAPLEARGRPPQPPRPPSWETQQAWRAQQASVPFRHGLYALDAHAEERAERQARVYGSPRGGTPQGAGAPCDQSLRLGESRELGPLA